MRTTSVEHISLLQENPKNIRNICILAHVDHGKTTLADSLVASNGIISSRLAGKLRYMDSREDEQIRGITMKSSAVSLHHAKDNEEFLINLIDSPGHVDFSSEVSTAVRLCDGAIVVVDAVEGVSPQTQVVLRQAWLENIHPCLVVNKIDRLITELKYSPVEAYLHLQQILEQVNAITGKLFSSDVMEKSSNKVDNSEVKTNNMINDDTAVSIDQWSSGLDEVDDSTLYFSPDLGNVVFASALDGWGFSINDFAAIYSKKLGLNADILRKTLWGDFYLDNKSKRIFKKAQSKGKKPLFVQFILQNIWSIYDAVVVRRDKLKMEQIVQSLNLTMSARDGRSTDPRVQLQAILGKWLPLSSVVLNMVVDKLPSPLGMKEERVEKLMCNGLQTFESLPKETKNLKHSFLSCTSSDGSPVIVFVSKMFAVDDSALPKHKKRPLTQEEIAERRQRAREKHAEMLQNANQNNTHEESIEHTPIQVEEEKDETPKTHFVAFARVYSGTIKKGQSLYVLGPRHDPSLIAEKKELISDKDNTDNNSPNTNTEGLSIAKSVDLGVNQNIASFTVDDLYLLMGRELEALDCVPAGNVLGIGGLQHHVLKSATVANTLMCPPFTALHIEARPIVRVALEPVHHADLPALTRGIRLLNQADPCVETFTARTGELVIVAAGEVHLQKCVDDLKERFACVPFCVSSPIIPFRETVIRPPTMDMVNEAIAGETIANPVVKTDIDNEDKTLVEITTANKTCTLKIRAVPIPEKITKLLNTSTETIKLLVNGSSCCSSDDIKVLYSELKRLFDEEESDVWKDAVDKIWAFGPDRTGQNILLNRIPGYHRSSIWQAANKDNPTVNSRYRNHDNSILSGFQLATLAGPLCEEPLMGVCFVIEDIITEQGTKTSQTSSTSFNIDRSLGEVGLVSEDSPGKDPTNVQNGFKSVERIQQVVEKDEKSIEENLTTANQASDTCKEKGISQRRQQLIEQNVETLNQVDENSKKEEIREEGNNPIANADGNDKTVIQVSKVLTNKDVYETNENAAVNDDENIAGQNQVFNDSREKENCAETYKDDKQGNSSTNSQDSKNLDQENDENFDGKTTKKIQSSLDRLGPFSGQLMSAVKEGCRRAFQLQPMRLVAAMYTCHVQATAEVLGRLYAVIGKREGRVLSETMMEGSDVFDVEAVLPVAESFGFSEEIRKRTSGLANPQLVFSHWEVVDIDPYWVPTTEEEYTHYGAKADSDNQARKYMNTVRRRKGLYVDEKTVEHAEKQRTLKK